MVLSSRRDSDFTDRRVAISCGYGVTALLDTGAEVTLMEVDTYRRLQRILRRVMPLRKTSMRLSSANGSRIKVVGSCVAEIPGLPEYKYIVVMGLQCEVVLGNDFCEDHTVAVEFRRGFKAQVRIGHRWQEATRLPRVQRVAPSLPLAPPNSEYRKWFGSK